MSVFEQFVNWLFQHPVIGFAVVAAIVSGLRSLFTPKPKRKLRDEEPTHQSPPPEDDLEARVRRNFEEMMRRRGAAAAAPATPAPAPAPRPSPKPRVVDYDERARQEPVSTEAARSRMVEGARVEGARVEGARVVRAARRPLTKLAAKLPTGASVQGTLKTAGAVRSARRDRLQEMRKAVFEPRNLRRAIILREILDPAVALRERS